MSQLITEPTHIKGKTLDILLTNSKDLISKTNVSNINSFCKSDHYLINFEVKTNLKHIKAPKRKIQNFKKANWGALNRDLNNIQWNTIIDCMEPELAWLNFKNKLFPHQNSHSYYYS